MAKFEMTKKQQNTARKGIKYMTGTMGQTLKVLGGLYDREIEGTKGMTVADYFAQLGVERFVTKTGAKKGFTPALILAAWADELKSVNADKSTVAYIYKRVNVLYEYMNPNDPDGRAYKVYATKEDAIENKPLKLYKRVPVDAHRWNIDLIMKGLEQSRNIDVESAKAATDLMTAQNLKTVWIMTEKVENGVKTYTPSEIDAKSVSFD